MSFNQTVDVLLNIFIPLVVGLAMYILIHENIIPPWVNYHLSDGLWAYSLQSGILIVWSRKVNIPWTVISLLLALALEILQFFKIAAGTGDAIDILVYFIFSGVALLSNNFFKSIIYAVKAPNHVKT